MVNRIIAIFKELQRNPWKVLFLLLYVIVSCLLWEKRGIVYQCVIKENMPYMNIAKIILDGVGIMLFVYLFTLLVVALTTPIGSKKANMNLLKIGFTNKTGEPPRLMAKYKDAHMPKVIVYEFESLGIPISEWEKKLAVIESALNIQVVTLGYGRNIRQIIVKAVSSNKQLPNYLAWTDKLLSTEDFELVLGESLYGLEKLNLVIYPHILIGGGTNSGKSTLMKTLLMQCIKKQAQVYIIDFKGGVDFSAPLWHQKCKIIIEQTELLHCLEEITVELEKRRTLLIESGCPNIETYNKKNSKSIQRIIFANDEIAEILDKTGLSKEQKEIVSTIERQMSFLARQGRAFGIHLFLSTQRPSADILSGQIKNNIALRICGRADRVLSEIILDNTSAVEKVPQSIQGRFITNEGTIFQGYYIDDDMDYLE